MYHQEPPGASGTSRPELYEHAALYTELRPLGEGWWQGKCPLPKCTDTDENFIICPNSEGHVFTCEACGESGNTLDFVTLMTNPNGYELGLAGHNLTDLGNAERLVAAHGDDLRYVHPWRRWLWWNGKRWEVDVTGEVERRAVGTVRSIYTEAEHAEDSDERKRIARHATASESRSRIDAMIALARSLPGIPVEPERLDADPWLLNCSNGTVDLRTGELREHRRDDLITKLAPVEYGPDATAPTFERFLRDVLVEKDVVEFVRRFAGYSLTGSTEERVFAILHGTGKNGKSTLVELLQDVLGDYATNTDTETILAKKYSGVGNDVAALKGARFVSAAEVEQGRALAESKVKQLTGRDTVTARFLFAEPFNFRPEFKLWLSTNNRPIIRGTDDAIWDRIKLIPFTQRFEGEHADRKLPEKLRAELPGVLAWMVRGCLEWQRTGLGNPERVVEATESYRAEMDTLAGFIDECCIVRPDVWCKFADLYTTYTRWCEESNEKAESKRRFADRLTERGFEKDTGTDNVKIRRGIALRYDGDPDPSRMTDPDPDPGPQTPGPTPNAEETGNSGDGELPIGNSQNTCKTQESNDTITDHDRLSDLKGRNLPREESYRKNGNDRYFGNSGGDYDEIAAILADPPKWLAEIIDRCRREPGRYLNSTANNIATAVYGSPSRWREVKTILANYLRSHAA